MPPMKATKRKKPIKMLVYGDSGVGKTHFALHATPGKTLVYDQEGGTDLFEGFVEFDFWVDDHGMKTRSYKELQKAIEYLASPTGKDYETFIIDPVSILWSYLQEERQDYKEEAVTKKRGAKENETDLENFTQRDWNIVKKMYNAIINSLLNLPQNVILLAREKEIVEMVGNEPKRTGEYTFDGEKNTKYAVDYTIRLTFDKKKKKRQAIIDKVRLPGSPIQIGDTVDSPTFETFRKLTDGVEGEATIGMSGAKENLYEEPPQEKPVNWPVFWNECKKLNYTQDDVLKIAGVTLEILQTWNRVKVDSLYKDLKVSKTEVNFLNDERQGAK